MEILFLIVLILGIIGFINLSGRISRLEMLMGSGMATKPQAGKSDIPSMAELERQALSANSGYGQDTGQVPVTAAAVAKSKESSEEAGGRLLGKIGIAAVFFGVAFFLQYAFANNIIGITGRLILGILVGLILLGIGQFLRSKYLRYSDILMGGGIAILYLTIFAAAYLYKDVTMISQPVGLFFVLIVTALAVVLSVVDDSTSLAVVGIAGGFFVPFLISYGIKDPSGLFAYILLLDIGVLAISFKERWLKLSYIAFFGTILLFLSWLPSYSEIDLPLVMFFLTAYFIIFLATSISHHIYRKEASNGLDLFLITFNAVGYFGMSYFLLEPHYYDFLGFFAVTLAAGYAVISFLALATNPKDELLNYYLPGLAVLFLTLAIPIQLTGMWVTLGWLIEAVVIMLIARVANRPGYVIFSSVVYVIGVFRLFSDVGAATIVRQTDFVPILNTIFFLFLVSIAAAYCIGLILKNATGMIMGTKTTTIALFFFVVANVLTIFMLTNETSRIFEQKIVNVNTEINRQGENNAMYNTGNPNYSNLYEELNSIRNQKNTIVSIIWAVYAIVLIGVGFALRSRVFRMFGLIFFFVTALKVFIDVWSLGDLYRVVSSIVFGIIALLGSFAYAKYKHRLKEIMYDQN